MEQKGGESIIVEMLKHHFKDDEKAFERIDKRFENNEELMKNNGQHLSYFNKNLAEIKKMNENDKADSVAYRAEMLKFRDECMPMILSYKADVATKQFVGTWSDRIIQGGKVAGVVGTAVTAVYWVTQLLKKI